MHVERGLRHEAHPGITADIVDTDNRYRYRRDKGVAKVLLEELTD